MDIHQEWVSIYRTAENEPFFELAFDCIVNVLNAPINSSILDGGCGTCAHSIRLASRGFIVYAVGLFEYVPRAGSCSGTCGHASGEIFDGLV